MRKVSQAPWGRCSPLKIPEKDMLASLCMEAQDPQPCFSDLMHFVLYHMPIDGFDSQINWLRCNKLNMNMLQPTHWIKMSHWSIVCFAIKTTVHKLSLTHSMLSVHVQCIEFVNKKSTVCFVVHCFLFMGCSHKLLFNSDSAVQMHIILHKSEFVKLNNKDYVYLIKFQVS
jgi:hypothetical protein